MTSMPMPSSFIVHVCVDYVCVVFVSSQACVVGRVVWGRDLVCLVCLHVVGVVKVLWFVCSFYVGLILVMGDGVVPAFEQAVLGASLVVCVVRCL